MKALKKRWKIFQEEAKTRQTSHWDLDYMSREQLDALYNVGPEEQATPHPKKTHGLRNILRLK